MQLGKHTVEEHNGSLLTEHKKKFAFTFQENKNADGILQKLAAFQVAIPSWAPVVERRTQAS